MTNVTNKNVFGKTGLLVRLLTNLRFIFPLMKDYVTGKYRKIPILSIVGIAFTVLYVFCPFDIVPDYLLGVGQIDDAAVLTICLILVESDLLKYRKWKDDQSSQREKPE